MSFLGNHWPRNKTAGWAVIPYVVEAVAAAGTAVEAKQVSSRQAEVATQTADYNAAVDKAQAQQLALDANANIQKQRQDDQSYQSNQRAALAASGVLSGTGSPMALQATTAGRQEQDIQQYWTSTQEKESQLYGSAAEGVYEGAEESDIYHLQGVGDLFQGVGGVASAFGGAAKAGAFDSAPPSSPIPDSYDTSSYNISQGTTTNIDAVTTGGYS